VDRSVAHVEVVPDGFAAKDLKRMQAAIRGVETTLLVSADYFDSAFDGDVVFLFRKPSAVATQNPSKRDSTVYLSIPVPDELLALPAEVLATELLHLVLLTAIDARPLGRSIPKVAIERHADPAPDAASELVRDVLALSEDELILVVYPSDESFAPQVRATLDEALPAILEGTAEVVDSSLDQWTLFLR